MRSIAIYLFSVGCVLCACRAVAGEPPYNFRESEEHQKLSAEDKAKLEQVHREFMTLWGAVDRYADNHGGEPPETLDQLTPNYLSELPTDPFATSETADDNPSRYYSTSKDGWGYRYRKGSPGNRAWTLSSVGLSDFPYLANRGNYGLYVCKGVWISGYNPRTVADPEKEKKASEASNATKDANPSPGIPTRRYNTSREQSPGMSGISPTQPSLDMLPADARELIAQYERDKKPVQKEAQSKIRKLTIPLIASLKKIQDDNTKAANLDEAVAIRNWVRYLQQLASNVSPNPGTLQNYSSHVGDEFNFLVTGNNMDGGGIWGTDVYTTDSSLSLVAVHAGIIKPGETGVIKATILPGRESYDGSVRNGVNSSSWQSFPASFKVERGDDSLEENENKAPDSSAESETTGRAPFNRNRV
jgi:hypothetical protein